MARSPGADVLVLLVDIHTFIDGVRGVWIRIMDEMRDDGEGRGRIGRNRIPDD